MYFKRETTDQSVPAVYELSMSRAPPFPTSRGRSDSLSNSNGSQYSAMAAGTRPLQISRQPSRPTTPSNASFVSSSPRGNIPNTSSVGPSRPQRSELRSRGSEYSTERVSYADSSTTSTRSDVSQTYRPRPSGSGTTGTPANVRPRPPRLKSIPTAPTDDEQTPSTLSSVMSAFQSAGTRRRAMTNDSEDMDYQKERRDEIEAEKVRQQRIKDKVPGRRVNGKARTGDIDGK